MPGGLDLKGKPWIWGVAGALLVLLLYGAFSAVGGTGSENASAVQVADAEPLPPDPWDVEPTRTAPPVDPAPKMKDGVAVGGPDAMPPASAGSNGSYQPRPASERASLDPMTHGDPSRSAILLGDTALPPASAPSEIQAAISAANQLVTQPYRWGGGHAGWRSRGYDCSGAVSYALGGAGLLGAPATSGQLMSWGEPGRGKWLTVYANPGHVYAVIANLRWDTVGNANGSGPRWHPADAYPDGYVARHIPGL